MEPKKNKHIAIVIIVIFCIILGLLPTMFSYSVDSDESAIVIRGGRRIVKSVDQEGRYFKIPILDKVVVMPNDEQAYKTCENEIETANGEKYKIYAEMTWKILDPKTYYQRFESQDYTESVFDCRITEEINEFKQKPLSEADEEAIKALEESCMSYLKSPWDGIEVITVNIRKEAVK